MNLMITKLNLNKTGNPHGLKVSSEEVTRISISIPKMLYFLEAIENLECLSTILKMLSGRLKEEGVIDYTYKSLNKPLSNNRSEGFMPLKNQAKKTSLDNIFERVSESELAKPLIIKDQEAVGSFLIFPTFGPYTRRGIFILHSQALPSDHLSSDIAILDMVLQKIYMVISVIEAQQEEKYLALTKREIDVLACISSGLNNQEVANLLEISIHTVNGYLRSIMLKSGTNDRLTTGLVGHSTPQVRSRARKLIPR